jgi:hypothetical protein
MIIKLTQKSSSPKFGLSLHRGLTKYKFIGLKIDQKLGSIKSNNRIYLRSFLIDNSG